MIDVLQTCRAVLSITSSRARVATCADLIVIFSPALICWFLTARFSNEAERLCGKRENSLSCCALHRVSHEPDLTKRLVLLGMENVTCVLFCASVLPFWRVCNVRARVL